MRSEPKTTKLAALSFACGLHFALLQTSYFLLLEAHLSSRSQSYLIALFFWLSGLLVGLNLPAGERRFSALLAAGLASYYVAFGLARWIPFNAALYPAAAVCSVASGALPGYFFRFIGGSGAPVRGPLFHENNGFLLGLAVALKGALFFGSWLLAGGPLVGAALVAAAFAVFRREGARASG